MNRESFTTSPIVNKRRELEGSEDETITRLKQMLDMSEKGLYIRPNKREITQPRDFSELDDTITVYANANHQGE